ncbi:hypothetical protein [Methylophilus aquaticus]|uniref:IPTL-CTERM sorting domain-containing protein n=1 Tax=Methylophilus aquaticus TaxID=1971610 RepID=A0ABT9JNX8_9PROT|nr:hypothetical protein [Methylophilus aquaticus]MDP8566295.1 hypothetical protein [Methylophilus aquaticus]
MLRLAVVLSLLAAMPVTAHASTVISLESSYCSGQMSISSLSGASLSCDGNLTLNGGWINADASILIHADGDLLLENLNLNAQEISLSTFQGGIHIANTVNINAVQNDGSGGGQVVISAGNNGLFPKTPIIHWQAFDLSVNAGSTVHFNMPSTHTSAPSGVIAVGGQIVIKPDGAIEISSSQISSPLINTPLTASVSAVPEANRAAMLWLGLGLLAFRRRLL